MVIDNDTRIFGFLGILFIMPTILGYLRFSTLKNIQFGATIGFIATIALLWFTKGVLINIIHGIILGSVFAKETIDFTKQEIVVKILLILSVLILLRWYLF